MHMPIPENADAGARQLHAVPSKIAKVAKSARADTLLLSHFMARSLRTLEDNVQIIDDGFDGELLLAEDLYCQIVR
jgi:ribonuclease BN (tRNA processing enzyme)